MAVKRPTQSEKLNSWLLNRKKKLHIYALYHFASSEEFEWSFNGSFIVIQQLAETCREATASPNPTVPATSSNVRVSSHLAHSGGSPLSMRKQRVRLWCDQCGFGTEYLLSMARAAISTPWQSVRCLAVLSLLFRVSVQVLWIGCYACTRAKSIFKTHNQWLKFMFYVLNV